MRFQLSRVRAGLAEPSRWDLHYVERTGSTNDDARAAASEGAVMERCSWPDFRRPGAVPGDGAGNRRPGVRY